VSKCRVSSGKTREKNMTRKIIGLALGAMLFALSFPAAAQQPTKVPRIGFLATVSPFTLSDRVDAFRQGLRELGYVERKSIVIEWRFAENKADRLPGLAAELVRLKVDVIVTAAPPPTRAAKEATSTIPIVMAFDDDPVGPGLVASLARPGGNITGLATLSPEIGGKQLELLKEIVPKLFARGCPRDFDRPSIRDNGKGDRTRCEGARSEGSIPRRTKSQRY